MGNLSMEFKSLCFIYTLKKDRLSSCNCNSDNGFDDKHRRILYHRSRRGPEYKREFSGLSSAEWAPA